MLTKATIAIRAGVVLTCMALGWVWGAEDGRGVWVAQAPGGESQPEAIGALSAAQSQAKETAATTASQRELPRDALLLVLDSFSIVRMLDEADYVAQREEVARNLLNNLVPFLVGAQASASPVSPTTSHATRPSGRQPVSPATPPAPVKLPPKAAVTQPSRASLASGLAAGVPPGHENDPAYSRVPQKARIRAKFQAATEPYKQLRNQDAAKAGMVDELLRAARAALAKEQFDAAESYLDHALQMLGVQYK